MPEDFKGLSTFRLIIIGLLILSAGLHIAAPGDGSRIFNIPVILMLLALAALFLEFAVTWLQNRQSTPTNAGSDAPPRTSDRWLGRLNRILFHYRILNPQRERLESELRVAREIQFSLVPKAFPEYSEWREFDLHALLSPAREVGGDYYDFFMLDSNRLVLAVGDVSGKGVPAAMYMAVCRTAFRTLAREAKTPGHLLSQLNNLLARDSNSGLYITMACFVVDLPSGLCQYSIAGHPAPLHHSPLAGTLEFIDVPRESMVGLKAGVRYPVGDLRLRRGDTLLLYTDGVSEARNPEGDELGYPALRDMFGRRADAESCRELVAGMDAALREYTGGRTQEDDITLQAFRYWGAGGKRQQPAIDAGGAAKAGGAYG